MSLKIYTKTGDKGFTSLYGGKRLLKNNNQIEAYGSVDELNAHIGMILSLIDNIECKDFLINIQHKLFVIGTYLAIDNNDKNKLKLPDLTSIKTKDLENEIDRLEKNILPLKNFILPNGNTLICSIHISRCVCRRAERNCVSLINKKIQIDIIKYLNRLSDYLFVLSRYVAKLQNIKETIWEY